MQNQTIQMPPAYVVVSSKPSPEAESEAVGLTGLIFVCVLLARFLKQKVK